MTWEQSNLGTAKPCVGLNPGELTCGYSAYRAPYVGGVVALPNAQWVGTTDALTIDDDTELLDGATFKYFVRETFTNGTSSGRSNYSQVITAVNVRPVANPLAPAFEIYTVNRGGTLSVPATCTGLVKGLLCNDTDDDSPSLTVALVGGSGPSHAAPSGFTLNSNGSFTYTPDPKYSGDDFFTYTANDKFRSSNPVTVKISVTLKK